MEQDFNSLDAQREACEAYIRSQRSEGWVALARMYDDGGFSGGTMERPALRHLLADIAAGLIDTVVVYKVDRLTRSLTDFARIVDVFDSAKVSFVSVTQSFNTTTSMGRLTLNMLLSFAQFEREVTGERIRDKIAASKAKGMWMGGRPPLGYTVVERKLKIVSEEAETVREIYRRYLALGSVYDLRDELAARNICAKRHVSASGNWTGGGPLDRGALYHLLQNRLYRGEISHKGQIYPGEHEAIIDDELWDRVQAKLSENRANRQGGVNKIGVSLLAGLLIDEDGFGFTAVHANKKGRRYRYYVSRDLVNPTGSKLWFSPQEEDGVASTPSRRAATTPGPESVRCLSVPRRLPAADIEAIVENAVVETFSNQSTIDALISKGSINVMERTRIVEVLAGVATGWSELSESDKRMVICQHIRTVTVSTENVRIAFDINALFKMGKGTAHPHRRLPVPIDTLHPDPALDPEHEVATRAGAAMAETFDVVIPSSLRRVGMEMRHVIDGAEKRSQRKPDPSLVRTIALAHLYKTKLMDADGRSIAELAEECGVTSSYFSRVVRLAFLSPNIATAIIEGRQPIDLSSIKLTLRTDLAPGWKQQEQQLGLS